MITAAQIARDLELARKATPGPWITRDHGKDEECVYIESEHDGIASVFTDYGDASPSQAADADFIARSRTALPEYAEALREVMRAIAALHRVPCYDTHCPACDLIAAYHAREKPE